MEIFNYFLVGTESMRSDMMSTLRSEYWSPKQQRKKSKRYPAEIEKALDAVKFIADHLKEEDKEEQVSTTSLQVYMKTNVLTIRVACPAAGLHVLIDT